MAAAAPVTLRVMRLSQLRLSLSPLEELGDLTAAVAAGREIETLPGYEDPPRVSTANFCLQIPTRQGSVFVGETFEAYVSVLNSSSTAVFDVSLLVELVVVGEDPVVLHDTRNRAESSLLPGATIDTLVKHKVASGGSHALVCSIVYKEATFNAAAGGNPRQPSAATSVRTLKKVYRFSAVAPLGLKHRVINPRPGRAIAELTLDNCSPQRQSVLDVSLSVPSQWEVSGALPRPPITLAPGDVASVLFVATGPANSVAATATVTVETAIHGVGVAAAELHSFALDAIQPPPPIRLRLVRAPFLARVEEPFDVTLEVANDGPAEINAQLVFGRELSVYVEGPTRALVGRVPPSSTATVDLRMAAVVPGMHHISGIALTAVNTNDELVPSSTLGELWVV